VKAFLVHLNGKRLCTAGIGPCGVLSAIVNWVGGTPHAMEGLFHFHVGGLDSRTGEHIDYEMPELKVGDTVTVEIVDADQVDPETGRYVPDLSGAG
jgi:hypothetical protein